MHRPWGNSRNTFVLEKEYMDANAEAPQSKEMCICRPGMAVYQRCAGMGSHGSRGGAGEDTGILYFICNCAFRTLLFK